MDFATAESTRAHDGEGGIDHCNRTYCPAFPGVHVCGADHDENRFFTIAQMPFRTGKQARAAWESCRAECEVERDAADFVVDLNTEEGTVEDFWSNRQMLPRIAAILGIPT